MGKRGTFMERYTFGLLGTVMERCGFVALGTLMKIVMGRSPEPFWRGLFPSAADLTSL